jgi:PKD repeat protein
MTILTHRIARSLIVVMATALLAGGCSLDDQTEPSNMIGPSEFALSVSVTASPNQLPRDGSSQAVVNITVRDASGQPVSGQRLMLSLPVNVPSGTRLSSSEVMTDSNGQASVIVTAPIQSSTGNSIVVNVLPVGGNLDSVLPRTVSITLTPVNSSRPTPLFSFNPANPEIGQVVQFNASTTTDESVACLDSCSYFWDFGGEATATGRIVQYRFRAGGTYVVALTVTDSQGQSETARQTVTVSANNLPTVTVAATGDSRVGRPMRFTATTTVPANHRIVSYEWNFGDGTSTTTTAPTAQHTYNAQGLYVVRVTVRDDLGQTAQGFVNVDIGSGITADFSFEPAIVGEDVTFDASRSVTEGGATIRLYTWNWGDGSPTESTTSATIEHEFATVGTFSVTLTITDSEGRTASRSRDVTVQPAP